MHPAKILAGWLIAVWVIALIAAPEATTMATAEVGGRVVTGIATALDNVLPDETLPTVQPAEASNP
jgi:hypothetical protein